MITLYGYELEIYQVVLLVYVVGYGVMFGLMNTLCRFIALFSGGYTQADYGKLLDALWYGCIFVLVDSLI